DGGFGSGGWTSVNVQVDYYGGTPGVGLQSTGKVVVAGTSMFASGIPATAASSAVAARFTASGAVDSGKGGFGQIVQGKATGYTLNTFGTLNNDFTDLAVQPDDKVVAVGYTHTD